MLIWKLNIMGNSPVFKFPSTSQNYPSKSKRSNINPNANIILSSNLTKCESLYTWAYYSISNKGWYCKICQEFSTYGDEYWKTKPVKHGEHPGNAFTSHLTGEKHKKAVEIEKVIKKSLSKGNIMKQLALANEAKVENETKSNRNVLIKFFKVTYFS